MVQCSRPTAAAVLLPNGWRIPPRDREARPLPGPSFRCELPDTEHGLPWSAGVWCRAPSSSRGTLHGHVRSQDASRRQAVAHHPRHLLLPVRDPAPDRNLHAAEGVPHARRDRRDRAAVLRRAGLLGPAPRRRRARRAAAHPRPQGDRPGRRGRRGGHQPRVDRRRREEGARAPLAGRGHRRDPGARAGHRGQAARDVHAGGLRPEVAGDPRELVARAPTARSSASRRWRRPVAVPAFRRPRRRPGLAVGRRRTAAGTLPSWNPTCPPPPRRRECGGRGSCPPWSRCCSSS